MDAYEKLREILDASPTGAPASKAFDEILRILFTPQEAAEALPLVKRIVADILRCGQRLSALAAEVGDGYDTDPRVTACVRRLHELLCELEDLGCSFADWDFKVGIVDFPAELDGQPVVLCWRSDEDHLEYYRGPAEDHASRRPIPPEYLNEEPARYRHGGET